MPCASPENQQNNKQICDDDKSKFNFFRNSRFKNKNNFVDIDNEYKTFCILIKSLKLQIFLKIKEQRSNDELCKEYISLFEDTFLR